MKTKGINDSNRKNTNLSRGLENSIDTYIEDNGALVSVDWKRLVSDREEFNRNASEGVECEFWPKILHHLQKKGVLTPEVVGSYHAIGGGRDLSPSYGEFSFYFTEAQEAEKYRVSRFSEEDFVTNTILFQGIK